MIRILLILSFLSLQSCSLWPYERDFDCPIGEGLKCKSLYEVSQLADQGYFGPNGKRQQGGAEVGCNHNKCLGGAKK